MKGTILLRGPKEFSDFVLAHRLEHDEHRFEVAYGSSFNELYYDFTPSEFLRSADRSEVTKQLERAGAEWLLTVLIALAEDPRKYTASDIQRLPASRER